MSVVMKIGDFLSPKKTQWAEMPPRLPKKGKFHVRFDVNWASPV